MSDSNYIVVKTTKSEGVALLLVFFLGPLGLFYSTIKGAVIMTFVVPICLLLFYILFFVMNSNNTSTSTIVFGAISIIFFFVIYWIICFRWAYTAVQCFNEEIEYEYKQRKMKEKKNEQVLISLNKEKNKDELRTELLMQLEKLSGLKDKGVITDEVFELEKAKILAQLGHTTNTKTDKDSANKDNLDDTQKTINNTPNTYPKKQVDNKYEPSSNNSTTIIIMLVILALICGLSYWYYEPFKKKETDGIKKNIVGHWKLVEINVVNSDGLIVRDKFSENSIRFIEIDFNEDGTYMFYDNKGKYNGKYEFDSLSNGYEAKHLEGISKVNLYVEFMNDSLKFKMPNNSKFDDVFAIFVRSIKNGENKLNIYNEKKALTSNNEVSLTPKELYDNTLKIWKIYYDWIPKCFNSKIDKIEEFYKINNIDFERSDNVIKRYFTGGYMELKASEYSGFIESCTFYINYKLNDEEKKMFLNGFENTIDDNYENVSENLSLEINESNDKVFHFTLAQINVSD